MIDNYTNENREYTDSFFSTAFGQKMIFFLIGGSIGAAVAMLFGFLILAVETAKLNLDAAEREEAALEPIAEEPEILGQAAAMQEVFRLIERAGPTRVFTIWRLEEALTNALPEASGWQAPALTPVAGTTLGITGRTGDGVVRTSACHEEGAAISRRRSLGPLKTAFPTKSQNPIACQNAAPSTKPRAAQAKDCRCSCRREIANAAGSGWRE